MVAARVGRWFPFIGFAAGTALGVVARMWMRHISADHEFSWSGTLFIVLGFSVFGLGQATVARAAQRPWRRWARAAARGIAAVTVLPLFAAAGGVMAPTVVFGGLARWRTRWPWPARAVCALLVLADIVLVCRIITEDLGWSARAVSGIAWMLAIYGALVWCAECTFRAEPSRSRSTA